MKIVTFYHNSRYAGGRSHHNIKTLEYIPNKWDSLIDACEYKGIHIFPTSGEDFSNGILDESGNEVMDAEAYEKYIKSGVGRLDMGDTIIYSCELKDVDASEFERLPDDLQLEYINLFFENVTAEMLEFAKSHYSVRDAFERDNEQWEAVKDDLKKEEEEA